MIWWLKARHARIVLPASFVLYVIFLTMLHDRSIMLPSVLAGTVRARLILFVPLAVVLGLAFFLESRVPAPEISGIRPVLRFDAAISLLLAFGSVLLSTLLSWVTESPEVAAAGRNSAFLVGLLLLAWPLCREMASLIPTAWLLLVMLAGFRSPLDAYPWTIIPESAGRPHSWIVSFVVLCAGIAAQLFIPQRDSQ